MKKLLTRRVNGSGIDINNLEKTKDPIKINKKLIIIVLFAIIIGVGFGIKNIAMSNSGLEETEYTVLTKQRSVDSLEVKGQVECEDSIAVSSNTNNSGYVINKINVKVGDKVKAGDVLATIDTSQLEKDIEYSEELNETTNAEGKIKLENAKNEYETLLQTNDSGQDEEFINAEENLNLSSLNLDNAQKDYENNKMLFEATAIAANELNQYETILEKAKYEHNKALTMLESVKVKIKSNLNTAKNNYEAAKVSVNDNARNIQLEIKLKQLEDCTIKAPCDGTITARNIEVGGFPSGILFRIQDLNNVNINIDVKEVNVPDIKVGQKAEIKTDSLKSEILEGEVLSIEPMAKSESGDALALKDDSIDEEAEYKAKIKINEVSDKINVGMKARIKIILDEKEDAYIISSNSIVNNNDSHSIYIAEKQEKQYAIKEIPVILGTEGDYDLEVIGDDLYDGIIVINDPMKYKVGQLINIKKVG